jgi:hypothetical protein
LVILPDIHAGVGEPIHHPNTHVSVAERAVNHAFFCDDGFGCRAQNNTVIHTRIGMSP